MITLDEFKSTPKGIFRIQLSDVAGKEPYEDIFIVQKITTRPISS